MIRVERTLDTADMVDALTGSSTLYGPSGYTRSDDGAASIAGKVRATIGAVGAKTAFAVPDPPSHDGTCESLDAGFTGEFSNG